MNFTPNFKVTVILTRLMFHDFLKVLTIIKKLMMVKLTKKITFTFLLLILPRILPLVFRTVTLITTMQNGKLLLAVDLEQNLLFAKEIVVCRHSLFIVHLRTEQNGNA